jgi:hypothetical protein
MHGNSLWESLLLILDQLLGGEEDPEAGLSIEPGG